jgi:DNA invertase Pin-like site-specific DNA recombinase
MNEPASKAILYTRSATAAKHNPLQYQEKVMREYCVIHNIQVIGVYEDITPCTTFKRPGFNKLLNFLKQNPDVVNFILVTGMDRFSRTFEVVLAMMDQLDELGVEIKVMANDGVIIQSDAINLN